jgi:hypothetical protein
MTNLSFAAQAVLDAWSNNTLYTRDKEPQALAAALRAVADEVAPETPESDQDDPDMLKGIWSERRSIREELLAIVNELETQ